MWVTSKRCLCVCEGLWVFSCFCLLGRCVCLGVPESLVPSSSELSLFFVLSPLLYFLWHCWFLSYREIWSAVWDPTACICDCVCVCVCKSLFLYSMFVTQPTESNSPWRPLNLFLAVGAWAIDGLQTQRWHSHICAHTHTSHTCKHSRNTCVFLPNENLMLKFPGNQSWCFIIKWKKDVAFAGIIRCCLLKNVELWQFCRLHGRSTDFRRAMCDMMLSCACLLSDLPSVFYFVGVF